MRQILRLILIMAITLNAGLIFAQSPELEPYEKSSLSPEAFKKLNAEILIKQPPNFSLAKSEESASDPNEPPISYEQPQEIKDKDRDVDSLSGILDSLPEKNLPIKSLSSSE